MKGELGQMEFIPYKVNEVFTHKYIQVPKELFLNEFYKKKLNSDSKILYAFLLDRLALSIKNNWTDENGNTYLIYTRKDLQELLDLSDKTVTKAFKQLRECNLIFEKRQGKNKPNLIYPGKIQHDETLNFLNRKNCDSGDGKNTIQDSENLRGNYTNNNNTKRVNSKNSFCNYEQRTYPKEDFLLKAWQWHYFLYLHM